MNFLAFLLLFITFTIGNVHSNNVLDEIFSEISMCEDGWYAFGKYCYRAEDFEYGDGITWPEASARCKMFGGYLASIHSKEENDFITEILEKYTKTFTWIGLNDRKRESIFQWDDGSSFDYTNWKEDEPSGSKYGNEDCVGMYYDTRMSVYNYRHGKWNDGPCMDEHPYICQKNGNPILEESSQTPEIDASLDVTSAVPDSESNQQSVSSGVFSFENLDSLLNASENISPGSLSFLTDKEALVVRVQDGWQYVQLGSVATLDSTKKLRLIALNRPQFGDMGGISGVNRKCNEEAKAANLPENFRVFLASSSRNLKNAVKREAFDLPVVNIKGERLFNSWRNLFEDTESEVLYSADIYSFEGRSVLQDRLWSSKKVWHGSNRLGNADLTANCDDWHSMDYEKVGLASSLYKRSLLKQEKSPCNKPYVVLCIEKTSEDDFRKAELSYQVNNTVHVFSGVDVEL